MNSKNAKTLSRIFKDPMLSNIVWKDIESLFNSLGALITEGSGSRLAVDLNNVTAVFHRPHPKKETHKGAVKSVRRFLAEAGIDKDFEEKNDD